MNNIAEQTEGTVTEELGVRVGKICEEINGSTNSHQQRVLFIGLMDLVRSDDNPQKYEEQIRDIFGPSRYMELMALYRAGGLKGLR